MDDLSKVKLKGFSMLSIKSNNDYVFTFGEINDTDSGCMSAGRDNECQVDLLDQLRIFSLSDPMKNLHERASDLRVVVSDGQ